MRHWFGWLHRGSPFVWLTSGAVSISLLSVLFLLLMIGSKGLAYFWPAPIYEWPIKTLSQDQRENFTLSSRIIGQIYETQDVRNQRIAEPLRQRLGVSREGKSERLVIKIANREHNQSDFISILASQLGTRQAPADIVVLKRKQGGDFFGRLVGVSTGNHTYHTQLQTHLDEGLTDIALLENQITGLVEKNIKPLDRELANLQRQQAAMPASQDQASPVVELIWQKKRAIHAQLAKYHQQLDRIKQDQLQYQLIVMDSSDRTLHLPLSLIEQYWFPNAMTWEQKVRHWLSGVGHFLADDPRESNSEGGLFPAIFGTVLLVILMSVIVMPLGVIAAVYLNEYANNNFFTRLIRISVVNLAGVPSIVYGVFGLGFFVYTLGGNIDRLFYAEALPAPTFGTPGILWSALTLALLTLPVVIVTTEEGLSRIPQSVRHGSLALGATQFETLSRIVLPMATPAMLTGLILAIARAAGEVAPLMLVGVVKLSSNLPVDGEFPYLHLDRKFMHLGFHIYDVGFQTTNIEAARPLVYATSLLLVVIIVLLNLTAIRIRNNLREKYRILEQG